MGMLSFFFYFRVRTLTNGTKDRLEQHVKHLPYLHRLLTHPHQGKKNCRPISAKRIIMMILIMTVMAMILMKKTILIITEMTLKMVKQTISIITAMTMTTMSMKQITGDIMMNTQIMMMQTAHMTISLTIGEYFVHILLIGSLFCHNNTDGVSQPWKCICHFKWGSLFSDFFGIDNLIAQKVARRWKFWI